MNPSTRSVRAPVGCWLVYLLLGLLLPGLAAALTSEELLPNEEAFRFSHHLEGRVAVFNWDIVDGYHLYQKRFKFVPRSPGLQLGPPEFPKGETKHDTAFGVMEIYRGHLEIRVPVLAALQGSDSVRIEVASQGCADAGVCYTPHKETVALALPAAPPVPVAPAAAGSKLHDLFDALGFQSGGQGELLPPDKAFRFYAEMRDANTIWVSWQVAEGYYLYREKFAFALHGAAAALGHYEIPHGDPKQDPEFGSVEVFHRDIGFALPLERAGQAADRIELEASFQGCADRGVCYPPMKKTVMLELPDGGVVHAGVVPAVTPAPTSGECEIGSPNGFIETEGLSEQCAIAASLRKDSVWLTALSFLGMGLLLAFTPCIFPMIPILSGIIVGHGHRITTARAFMLSLSYVLASALAYTVFGVLAGLFGSNLQALFQTPAVIIAFSGLFVALALSMFDLYTLQLPSFLQSRLGLLSARQHGGTLASAAVMGMLSALIVGPCVAAPLAGALIFIGQTGDAWLGGVALFSLGLGMGLPLLAIGCSAGKLLPRAGVWMNAVKSVFGVGLLGIAVWLLDRILPSAVTLLLWALLLIVPAIYMGALDALPPAVTGWRKLWKGLGIAMLAYGVLMLIGVATNSTNPLQPLRAITASVLPANSKTVMSGLAFRPVKSTLELNKAIADARARDQVVMLDFYADWCVSCKEMEQYTFKDPRVIEALAGVLLLKADVTDISEQDVELMKRFSLIGPPATLFFGQDGEEVKPARVIGYMEADQFLAHLRKVLR